MAEAAGLVEPKDATEAAADAPSGSGNGAAEAGSPQHGEPSGPGPLLPGLPDRYLLWAALGLVLLPLVVTAVTLVVDVRPGYMPTADHALMEMQVRDVGRHELYTGLYSRGDWSHPGPLFAYLTAPLYWITGSTSVALNLMAVLINGASIVGMGFIARRRGGLPALLCTFLGAALLMRTLGAEFVRDPWNNYVTVLPFGLMVFLTWAMLCREVWALPVGILVASFLAQTHVGFVILAVPLLVLGAAGLFVGSLRDGDADERRRLFRYGLLSAGMGVVLWLPPAIDVLTNSKSNVDRVVRYFRQAGDKEGVHSLSDGWGVVTGQFGLPPEWLTRELGQNFVGEDEHMYSRPLPVLLLFVALGAAVLWRRTGANGRWLTAALGATLAVGIVAVARTIGPAFYYRLRWVWIGPLVAFVLVGWALWLLVADRWRVRGPQVLVGSVLAGLLVLAAVNSFTAVTSETRAEGDGDVVAALLPGVLEEIERRGEGVVVVGDAYSSGAWYARGMVLQLEKRGIEVRVPADKADVFGDHRVVRPDEPVAARLMFVQDDHVDQFRDDPNLRLLGEWSSISPAQRAAAVREQERLTAEIEAGRLDGGVLLEDSPLQNLYDVHRATYYAAAVFVQVSSG